MVTSVFPNNCVSKGVFGPGMILRRIIYGRESRDKKTLNLVTFYSGYTINEVGLKLIPV